MPFASLFHCLCWCLQMHQGFGAGWPSAEWCQAGVSGLNKRVQQLMPAPGPCALLQVALKCTSKNTDSTLHGHTCLPDRALRIPWERTNGICTLAQAARDHPCSHGDAVLQAQGPPAACAFGSEPSSKPELMLQEVSSAAGMSLTDSKDPLEMS